jgi:hypothetical protein
LRILASTTKRFGTRINSKVVIEMEHFESRAAAKPDQTSHRSSIPSTSLALIIIQTQGWIGHTNTQTPRPQEFLQNLKEETKKARLKSNPLYEGNKESE